MLTAKNWIENREKLNLIIGTILDLEEGKVTLSISKVDALKS